MIECIKYKHVNKGSLLGFADLCIDFEYDGVIFKTEIFGCGVFQKENRRWVTMPSNENIGPNGLKRYFAHVRFSERARMDDFSRMAMTVIQPLIDDFFQDSCPLAPYKTE